MKETNYVDIGAWASVIDEEDILWLSCFHFNGLFKYDLKKQKMEYVTYFNKEPIYSEALHQEMCQNGDKIIIFPLRDRYIWTYNKKEKILDYIDIPQLKEGMEFKRVTVWKDIAYLTTGEGTVYQYNFRDNKVEIESEITQMLNLFLKNESNDFLISNYMQYMIISSNNGNHILKVNLDTKEKEDIVMDINSDVLNAVLFDGRRYWMALRNSMDLILWSPQSREKTILRNKGNTWCANREQIPYADIYCFGAQIWVTNYYSNCIMRANEDDKLLEVAFSYPDGFHRLEQCGYGAVYKTAQQIKNWIYFIPQRGNMLLMYDTNQKSIMGMELRIDKAEIPYMKDIIIEKLHGCNYIKEDESCITVRNYIQTTVNNDFKKQNNNIKDVGRNVWKHIN